MDMHDFNLGFILFLIGLIFFRLLIVYFLKQRKIRTWKRSLNITQNEEAFNRLYKDTNGFLLSLKAREKSNAIEYTYGEIEFDSFIALLSLIGPNKNTIFYDLGSGTGKAVLACAMVYPVKKSIGVELFPELFEKACEIKDQLALQQGYEDTIDRVDFRLGNFLDIPIDDATLVFINASTYHGIIWELLSQRLENLPHLETVISTSKALLSDNFYILKCTQVQMSWGVVFAYIQKRKDLAIS